MKKILLTLCLLFSIPVNVYANDVYSIQELKKMNIQANSPIQKNELENAKKILLGIHQKTYEGIKNGKGPFYAEIYDKNGNLVASGANSVIKDNCSLYHAEINTIKNAHEKFKNYDLAPEDLTIYINAEPCIMCMGAIMWSGIKTIYFSVTSKDVEKITGFDEGFKPNWLTEFKKRGIKVYGNIEADTGKQVLQEYVKTGNEIYKPTR